MVKVFRKLSLIHVYGLLAWMRCVFVRCCPRLWYTCMDEIVGRAPPALCLECLSPQTEKAQPYEAELLSFVEMGGWEFRCVRI